MSSSEESSDEDDEGDFEPSTAEFELLGNNNNAAVAKEIGNNRKHDRKINTEQTVSDIEEREDVEDNEPVTKSKRKSIKIKEKEKRHSERKSEREERLINKTVARLQEIMTQGNYMQKQGSQGKNQPHLGNGIFESLSNSTIYEPAIQPFSNRDLVDHNAVNDLFKFGGDVNV